MISPISTMLDKNVEWYSQLLWVNTKFVGETWVIKWYPLVEIWPHETSLSKWSSYSKVLKFITWVTEPTQPWVIHSASWVLNVDLNSCRICASSCRRKSIEYQESSKRVARECDITAKRYCKFLWTNAQPYMQSAAFVYQYFTRQRFQIQSHY